MRQTILLLAALLFAAPLHGQAPLSTPPTSFGPPASQQAFATTQATDKDVVVARVLSALIPGTGHIYAGESGKGWGLMALSFGSILGGRFLGILACDGYHRDGIPECTAGQVVAGTGALIGIATIIYQFVDAGAAARRHNEGMETGGTSQGAIPVVLYSRALP